jgi:hypothetical protein
MATAWGTIVMSVAATGALDVMGAPLVSLGNIKEDSMSITPEDGGSMQLFGTGHVLIDELKNEPSLKIAATLVGLANAKQFWTVDAVETGQVKSLIKSGNYSVKFASAVVGSDSFEAPKCIISGTPVFSEKEGWTVTLEITILKGAAGYLFELAPVV